MPKRSIRNKRSEDMDQLAKSVVEDATGESNDDAHKEPPQSDDVKNPAAVALGRLSGKKGGKARAEKLTPEQRSEIAKKAAIARWKTSDSGESTDWNREADERA